MANYDNARFRRGKNTELDIQERSPVRRGILAGILVTTLAGGLVATLAIPAYAFAPGSSEPRHAATAATELTRSAAQAVDVPTQATTLTFARDGVTATAATSSAASIGSAVAIAGPVRTFPVTSVFAVAARYQGVPYVFGGASPRGFDCSGLVKYVWAKFGKNLPHSASAQARMGKRISRAAARPGDLVVMPGHIGFYAGNGRILSAPYPGQRVRIQPIWTNNYYIVRL